MRLSFSAVKSILFVAYSYCAETLLFDGLANTLQIDKQNRMRTHTL